MSRLWLVLLVPCVVGAQTAVWPSAVVTDAQLLTAVNICSAQLAAPVTSTGATTFQVTANSPIASCFAANMELRVDNEYVQLISVGSGTITVTRGFDFSVAATHAKYAPVTNVLAAWSHNALRVEVEAIESWLHGGGGGGGGMLGLATSVSGTTLMISCASAPCNVRIGSMVYSVSAGSAVLASGTGTAYVYVTSAGVLTVGYSGISLSCSGCTATGGVTTFPTDSFPVAIWSATSGAWGSGTDARAPYSRDLVVASTGLTSALASGIQTIALDPGVVNSAWPGSLTTTSSTTDTVSIAAVTSSSHCTLTATNASAASNWLTTYISAKGAGNITVTHTATSGMTYDVLCSVN